MRIALVRSRWGENLGNVRAALRNLRKVEGTRHNKVDINKIKRACRSHKTANKVLHRDIKVAEEYLKIGTRKAREAKIRECIITRNKKFDDPKKKKMKQVISSIMRRMTRTESINKVATNNGMVTSAGGVARAVTAFYTKWYESKTGVLDRWESMEA